MFALVNLWCVPKVTRTLCFKFSRIKEQPRFPAFSKNHAHLFLHACLWNVDDAKKALQKYSQIHANSPEIFDNRDIMGAGVQMTLNAT